MVNDKLGFDKDATELADVMNYCIQLAQKKGYDVCEIINSKIDKNEKKYPIDKSKGVSTKYDKL